MSAIRGLGSGVWGAVRLAVVACTLLAAPLAAQEPPRTPQAAPAPAAVPPALFQGATPAPATVPSAPFQGAVPAPVAVPARARAPRAAQDPRPATWAAAEAFASAWSQYADGPQQGPQGGWLGIGISCTNCSLSRGSPSRASWNFNEAPVVQWVDGESPAFRAGMRSGDTLTAVDGFDLTSAEGGRAFARIQPGQRVSLTYRRAGRDRQVQLTAVLRPEVRNDSAAIALMDRIRLLQDSQLRGAQEQMVEASRALAAVSRELAAGNRAAIEVSRRKLLAAESTLRALQGIERGRSPYGSNYGSTYGYTFATPSVPPVPPTPPYPPMAFGTAPPLRYSGRLGDLVNVEARGPGAVNVNEVGDSLIVVTSGETTVRIAIKPGARVAVPFMRGTGVGTGVGMGVGMSVVLTDEGDAVLGVQGSILRGDRAQSYGSATAFLVTGVPAGSHGDSLGLVTNDVIVELNGHAVTRASTRVAAMPGAVSGVVVRGGQRVTLRVGGSRR